MKRIGIIGGIGPESTIDYYKRIISTFQRQPSPSVFPEIIIYSTSLTDLMEILETRDWGSLTDWLVERVEALQRAGADFSVIGSNTPHIVFEDVRLRSPIPLLSIVEETCKKAESLSLKKLGLMGTNFTMKSDFYPKLFHGRGMSVIVPGEADQQLIHDRLFSEIERGIIKKSTREELLSIVKRMIDKDHIDSVILGCTELPLILDKDEYGIPFLNTTAIHVESIVKYCIDKET